MRVYNHEITMRRGEVLTIDKTIQNRDGSPYIIPKFNDNKRPHFVLTVSDSLYPNSSSIIYRMFMDVKNSFPTFVETNPVNVLDFEDSDGTKLYENGFETMTGLPSGYVNGSSESITYTTGEDALFYYPRPDGTTEYKWWDGTAWKNYECRLVCIIPHADTVKWKEGNYYYSIDLVDHYVPGAAMQNVSEVYPILGATKLSVMSNLRGGNVW